MKRAIVTPILLLTLVGCGKSGAPGGAQEELFRHLKDPYSAKVEETIAYKNFVCMRYNAKNSYGAYTGASWAILEQHPTGDWRLVKDHQKFCFDSTLKDLADPQQAAERAAVEVAVLAVMRKHKLIPDDADTLEKLPFGPCFKNAINLISFGTLATGGDDAQQRARFKQQYNDGLRQLENGQCIADS